MRLAIVGSRGFDNYGLLKQTLAQLLRGQAVECVVSGGAGGADSLGEFWAKEQGIPTLIIKPDWNAHGKTAGFIRNSDIVNNADMVVAFWDGASHGTLDTIEKAKQSDKNLTVIKYIPRKP